MGGDGKKPSRDSEMRKLVLVIFLFFLIGCSSNTPDIVSPFPKSNIPPKVSVSVNSTVDIATVNRIAITGVNIYNVKTNDELIEAIEGGIYDSFGRYFLKMGFDVVERRDIEVVMDELGLSMTGLISDNTAVEVGNLLGANAVCIIKVVSIDGEKDDPPNPSISVLTISFKVIKVETGQVAFTGMYQNAVYGMNMMFTALAEELLKTFGKIEENATL